MSDDTQDQDREQAEDLKAELLPARELMSLLGGTSGMPVLPNDADGLLGGPAPQGATDTAATPGGGLTDMASGTAQDAQQGQPDAEPHSEPNSTQTASSET